MTKFEIFWIDGRATIHYTLSAHVSQNTKFEIFDNLVDMYPKNNIIVSYFDGTMSTHIAKKSE